MISVILMIVVTIVAADIIACQRFKNEVSELFSSSETIRDKYFSYSRLKDLPQPVRNYFRNVLKDRRPYISCMRLKHDGRFKTGIDRDWADIEGEEYFTAANPGFIWRGRIGIVSARDMYLNARGRLVVSLFSSIPIIDKTGENFNQGELLRWLTESVMMPTALLPGENLRWDPIDDRSSLLTFSSGGIKLTCTVTFNERNEITSFSSKRYMNDRMENWTGRCGEYQVFDDVKVPTSFEAVWNLQSGDFSYALFRIKQIEFNKPEQF